MGKIKKGKSMLSDDRIIVFVCYKNDKKTGLRVVDSVVDSLEQVEAFIKGHQEIGTVIDVDPFVLNLVGSVLYKEVPIDILNKIAELLGE